MLRATSLRGTVNDMSAALKRRFNIVVLPTPNTLETEIDIVRKRVRELAANLELRAKVPTEEAIEKVVTIFRELRTGQALVHLDVARVRSGDAGLVMRQCIFGSAGGQQGLCQRLVGGRAR